MVLADEVRGKKVFDNGVTIFPGPSTSARNQYEAKVVIKFA